MIVPPDFGGLFAATRDLHKACEKHPVGQRMAEGNITRQEWSDWLWALRELHRSCDRAVPEHMNRDAVLTSDLALLPPGRSSEAAIAWSIALTQMPDVTGAAYVLHGAHRSGGRKMGPILVRRGLPVQHIIYVDPAAAQAWVRNARTREDCAPVARATFDCLLGVMDEIEGRRA
mgnify:CR=1 FL=1